MYRNVFIRALLVVALSASAAQFVNAQTFVVLHAFTGGSDGANPIGGITADAAGNFYGTTTLGGTGNGTVFRLKRAGSGWILSTLYNFQGGNDGFYSQV